MMNFSSLIGLLGLLNKFTSWQRPQQQQPQNQPNAGQGTNKITDTDLSNFVDQFVKANSKRR